MIIREIKSVVRAIKRFLPFVQMANNSQPYSEFVMLCGFDRYAVKIFMAVKVKNSTLCIACVGLIAE